MIGNLAKTSLRVVVCALLAAGASPAQAGEALFDAAVVAFDAYTQVSHLVDLDGDGHLDAAGIWTAPAGGIALSAFRNDGSGRFLPAWTLPIPSGAYFNGIHSAEGDFDGDGRTDFAVGGGTTIRYYRSNGLAPPALWATVTAIGEVRSLMMSDFDGDGRDDLAYAGGQFLRVIRSGPAGPVLPAAATTIIYGAWIYRLFPAEIDGDGIADLGLAAASNSTTTLSLHPVAGGIPGPPATLANLPVADPKPVAGDIDGDGDEDVVVFGAGASPAYHVLRRTGPASFMIEPPIAGGPATHLADVDGDGDLDGACCGSGGGGNSPLNIYGSEFEIAINTGGVFAPAFGIPGLGAYRLAGAADIDQDGDCDLVAGRCVYYAEGSLRPPALAALPLVTGPRFLSDPDGDGDRDLRVGEAWHHVNLGDGTFAAAPAAWPAPPAGLVWLLPAWPGDFDGDGDVDLLAELATPAQNFVSVRLLRNGGGGSLTDDGDAAPPGLRMREVPHPQTTLLASPAADGCLVEDVDGDGDRDVIALAPYAWAQLSRIWLNDGSGRFAAGSVLQTIGARHVADFDGDGVADLAGVGLAAGPPVPSAMIVRGLGGGAFATASPTVLMTSYDVGNGFPVADLDGDGDRDLALCRTSGITLFTNDGAGAFIPTNLPNSVFESTVLWPVLRAADLDRDGDVDLLASPAPHTGGLASVVYRNAGVPPGFDVAGSKPQMFLAAEPDDVDEDGDQDILSAGLTRNRTVGPIQGGVRRQYGSGLAGSGGIVPVLGGTGPFRPGVLCETRFRGGLGGAPGLLALGTAPDQSPLAGGTLLVVPAGYWPITLGGPPGQPGEGSLTIPWLVPAGLAGLVFFQQSGFADPGAPEGVSLSNGLVYLIGH